MRIAVISTGNVGGEPVTRAPFAALLLAAVLVSCGPEPEPLTSERLAEAKARWEASGVDTYVLELEMRGAINERRTVEVEAGIVIDMTAGEAPAARTAWDSWSVEGLFTLLERELENAGNSMATYGVEDSSLIHVDAAFCPELGYPLFFRRELPGSIQPIEWEVIRLDTP